MSTKQPLRYRPAASDPTTTLEIQPKRWALFSMVISLFFLACQNESTKHTSYAVQYNNYCSSCHIAPNPKNIPKDIWENSVLPEMAARMGYLYNDYDPYKFKSPQEKLHMSLSKEYPEQALIDSLTWWGIHDYITSLAPVSIPIDKTRKNRNKVLNQFSVKTIDITELTVPIITNIQFDRIKHRFAIGDATGSLHQWPTVTTTALAKKSNSPITSYHHKGNHLYVTEIGILEPSEIPKGLITKISLGITDTIISKLHRPVFTEIIDLNDDGIDELLICEFGNLEGQLSLLEESGSAYVKKSLYSQSGAIKIEIADMNNDGKKDIIALFSQGDEGIRVFYQKNDLKFDSEQVIRLPPEYGSSWFELLDYNGDGDLDIVLTNGDNADYSIFKKPYHGVRLFLNNSANDFDEKWFYPTYGTSRVLADDFDSDGDIDFAVTALFNDTENSPEEGFIYLENLNSQQFEFQPYTFKGNFTNGWLTMAKGDYDVDGDMDILLGSFNVKGLRKRNSIFELKEKSPVKLMLLENIEKRGNQLLNE